LQGEDKILHFVQNDSYVPRSLRDPLPLSFKIEGSIALAKGRGSLPFIFWSTLKVKVNL